MKRIGVLTGGGDAPGLNAVIRAVTKTAILQYGCEVFGIRDGYDGFLGDNGILPLGLNDVRGILPRGGTILGAANRGNPYARKVIRDGKEITIDVSEEIVKGIQRLGLDALIVLGGDGTLHIAHELYEHGVPVIGVPKTIDNDIVHTDCCPGFGSAAKYLATSIREVGLDLRAMTTTGGRAFVLEVMGRNAGWLAAACALAADSPDCAPHLILLPEVPFEEAPFLARVRETVERLGSCAIVVAEGLRGPDGQILSMQSQHPKGYVQLGGAGEAIADCIHSALGYKVHYAVADYLQRAARHLASKTDTAQAFAVGKAAVRRAVAGSDGVIGIKRLSGRPYRWRTTQQAFERVANLERVLPPDFIAPDGLGVTEDFRNWCRPLIAGEDLPRFVDGLPDYLHLQLPLLERRLPDYEP